MDGSESDDIAVRSSSKTITALWRMRRCPPGVFQDSSAPLSIHFWAVLTEMPSRRAASGVVSVGSAFRELAGCMTKAAMYVRVNILTLTQANACHAWQRLRLSVANVGKRTS